MNFLSYQEKLKTLTLQKDNWRTLSEIQKVAYLKLCMKNLMTIKDAWVNLSVLHKKIDPDSQTVGQEWLTGPVILMRALRMLARALEKNAEPSVTKITKNIDGQYVANVVPADFYESILFYGMTASIVIQKDCLPTQGKSYHKYCFQKGSLCLVLGAGNVSSMPVLDLLDKMFSHGCVCLLKLSPVNDYLHEIFETVFKPLIDDGFLRIVKGGKEGSEFLCAHELVDEIHVTGSYQTYQAIAKFNKKITAELGCVTPAIVVPGEWTTRDLEFHAKQIASAVENNASFNCNAVKVLVVAKNWKQKDEFLNAVRHALRETPERNAYYPGAQERYQKFLDHYSNAEILSNGGALSSCNGASSQGLSTELTAESIATVPWTLIPNVPVREGEYALTNEAFCGVLAVVELEGDGASGFLKNAVKTCNENLFGTLSCMLVVDPKTQALFNNVIEKTISDLKYGSIGVNCWAAVSFALYSTTWGAFPEGDLHKVSSGIGVVNNGYFFDCPEKSVVRTPFRPLLKPVWFYDHKNLVKVGKCLVDFEYSRKPLDFIKLILSALKS